MNSVIKKLALLVLVVTFLPSCSGDETSGTGYVKHRHQVIAEGGGASWKIFIEDVSVTNYRFTLTTNAGQQHNEGELVLVSKNSADLKFQGKTADGTAVSVSTVVTKCVDDEGSSHTRQVVVSFSGQTLSGCGDEHYFR